MRFFEQRAGAPFGALQSPQPSIAITRKQTRWPGRSRRSHTHLCEPADAGRPDTGLAAAYCRRLIERMTVPVVPTSSRRNGLRPRGILIA